MLEDGVGDGVGVTFGVTLDIVKLTDLPIQFKPDVGVGDGVTANTVTRISKSSHSMGSGTGSQSQSKYAPKSNMVQSGGFGIGTQDPSVK